MKIEHPKSWWAGLALIVATNAFALGGVAWNRSGEPDSRLVLSEREVNPSYRGGGDFDDSGMSVSLLARQVEREHGVLDDAQLRALGIDPVPPMETDVRRSQRLLERDALLVLEMDGPAYQEALERARQRTLEPDLTSDTLKWAQSRYRDEQHASRLFIVDIGLDREALRARHPDRTRYAIVRGTIRPWLHEDPDHQHRVVTVLGSVSPSSINVPHALRDVPGLGDLTHDPARRGSMRYQVAFGRRLEPIVEAVTSRSSTELSPSGH